MRFQKFKQEVLRSHCRECVNRLWGLDLQRQDCVYLPYMELCSSCGQLRNIVVDISRRKRWRIRLYQKGTQIRRENLT